MQTHAQNPDTHSRPQTSHSATAAYPCNAVVIVQAGITQNTILRFLIKDREAGQKY